MISESTQNPNSVQAIKHLREGLAVYKTGRSPNWLIRLRDPYSKKYVTRSSRETSRVEAIAAANEFSESYFRNLNTDLATSKATSFEYYAEQMLQTQASKTKHPESDRKLLYRQEDGLLAHFGPYDVSKVTPKMIREYLALLDANRKKPLAESTRAKHVIIIRKVLSLAVEDGLIKTLPLLPKQKTVDSPRTSFTDRSYRQFMRVGTECVANGDKVRGVRICHHHLKMFRFMVHSFLRPTEGELFGLKHKDITVEGDPAHLQMNLPRGKTGRRISVTMPLAVVIYKGFMNLQTGEMPDPDEYVWMPEYPNRTTAINTARRIFNHIRDCAGLFDEDNKLSPYSFRHYAIQSRLLGSNGKVNIYTLAKNAGTSVDQLERFYMKNMPLSKELIENLHSRD
ncbi:MAG: phage integrase SAM-like domain-containing protein [Pseudomonadota bacterium]